MKLGRSQRSTTDHRDLRLATYLAGRVTSPPFARNWSYANGKPIAFSLYGNDRYGDCTCAALGHLVQAAAAQTGVDCPVDLDVVLSAYEGISPWRRSEPTKNDDGAQCRDALKWFVAKQYVEKFVRLDEASKLHVEFAVNAGGGAYCGFDLPQSAKGQVIWDVAPAGGWTDAYKRRSWGGHAGTVVAYNARGVWIVTWGKLQFMTWEFFFTYCDEAWMPIADAWTTPGRLTASGFDLERLAADVAKVAA